MSNVIDFPTPLEEFKHTSYTGDETTMGVTTLDGKIQIEMISNESVWVVTEQGPTIHSRESLSEFFWIAAGFLDPQKRNIPKGKCIGCAYGDEEE